MVGPLLIIARPTTWFIDRYKAKFTDICYIIISIDLQRHYHDHQHHHYCWTTVSSYFVRSNQNHIRIGCDRSAGCHLNSFNYAVTEWSWILTKVRPKSNRTMNRHIKLPEISSKVHQTPRREGSFHRVIVFCDARWRYDMECESELQLELNKWINRLKLSTSSRRKPSRRVTEINSKQLFSWRKKRIDLHRFIYLVVVSWYLIRSLGEEESDPVKV